MAVLGVSSITPAFPQVADAFQLTPRAVGLLVTLFTLPGVILTPIFGVLADRLGRKRIIVPSLILFAVAGSACGLARDFHLLLGLRFLQGVGAASLGALNITIVGDLYRGWRRATAMGYNASVLSVGTASYPAIGGALAALGWFYPFFLPVLAFPVALLVVTRLRNPEPSGHAELGTYLRNALAIVRNPSAVALFSASLAIFIILYGAMLTFLPFLLRDRFDASAPVIGLVFSATSAATAMTSFRLGRMARRFSSRALVRAGFVLYGLALVGIPLAPSLPALLVPALVFGLGHGVNIPSVLTILSELAPDEYRAVLMSVNGMVLRLGQTLGPLVAGAMLGLAGLPGTYYGSAVLAAAMLVVVTAFVREG
jgi:MFS family permease